MIDLPGAGQAAVVLAKPSIPRTDPRFYQALVANAVLGGGYSARLNEEVRVKRGLSYGSGSELAAERSVGLIVAKATTRNDAAPQVVDLIGSTFASLVASPPDEAELRARKSSLIGDFGRRMVPPSAFSSPGRRFGLPLSNRLHHIVG